MKKIYLVSAILLSLAALFVLSVKRDAVRSARETTAALPEKTAEPQNDAPSAGKPSQNSVPPYKEVTPEEQEMDIQPYHTERQREEKWKWHNIARNGAGAKLTFHVTDSEGKGVTGASCRVTFVFGEDRGTMREGATDENGIFIAEGKTSCDVHYTVKKEGFYDMPSVTRHFGKRQGNDVKDGNWIPTTPTIEIKLKKKRNPVPMYVKWVSGKPPLINEPVGYDFEKGDWVSPYGKGEISDMALCFQTDEVWGRNFRRSLIIEFPGEYNGAYILNKDRSVFQSEYEAKENGNYQNKHEYFVERKDEMFIKNTKLEQNEYFVFRVRSKMSGKGEIASAQYGKIYGSFEYFSGTAKSIGFRYHFNPTKNDRNLEFATGQNLFGRRESNFEP